MCNSLRKRWDYMSCNARIPLEEFIIAVSLIINSTTFFTFNNKFYRQIFGTPMGSPLSPILADIVLQDIEEAALSRIPAELPFYIRYVDDILLAAPDNLLEVILEIFNPFHARLKFTMEVSECDRINFLDVTLIIENGVIKFDLYKKPTNSGRYLNFLSNHPMEHKKGVILGLFVRILLLSHPSFHVKNIKDAIIILLQNGYPLQFIFSTINNRIRKFMINGIKKRDKNVDNTLTRKFFTVPYMKGISESFRNITKKYDFRLAYTTGNSLNKYIKTGKDKLNPDSCCGVVYKINCHECDASYVGQTKRSLKTRVKEHVSDIKKSAGSLSVISDHRLALNHEFNWSDTQILDREASWYKRSVSEMIHIKRQHHGINKQSDTELLPEIYFPLIRNLPPHPVNLSNLISYLSLILSRCRLKLTTLFVSHCRLENIFC